MKIIKYKLMREINRGTEEEPDIVQTFHNCEIQCSEAHFEANYAIAHREAYNGEVTVEDVPDPVTEPTQLDRVEAQGVYTAMMTGTLLSYEEE